MTIPTTKPIPSVRELPLIGSLIPFRNDRLDFFMRILRDCPDIGQFHLGPQRVLLPTSPQMLQAIMVSQAEDFQGGFGAALEPLLGKHSLLNLFGEPHRQQRKMMAPSLQPRSVAMYAPIMTQYAAEAADRLVDGESVSVPELMTDVAMRIIGRVMFGKDIQIESRELSDAIKTGIDYVDYLTSTLVPLPMSWPTPRGHRTRQALKVIQHSIQEMLDERRREKTPEKDILSQLLAFRDEDGQGLSDEQLRDQTITLYLSGHETVALTLGWTWHLLLEHPDAYAALQREVDTVLGGQTPTVEDLTRLPYTLQVLKEAMRMYPTTYMLGRSPRHDVTIQGYQMRKGDLVLISNYILHRSEQLFEQPGKFIPERFSPEAEKQRTRGQYMPFGAGPKFCIGSHFAMQEALLVMAVVAQRVRFEALPGHKVQAVPGPSLRVTDYHARAHLRRAVEQRQRLSAVG